MSFRKQQVESTLKRAIAAVLTRELADPRIEGLISVTRVSVSPDLHEAMVFISVVPAKNQSKAIHGLRHAAGHIHSLVGKHVAMKAVPRLDFRLDETLKKQADVFQAIQRGLERETQESADGEAESSESSPQPPGRTEGPQEPDT
jgi:ribosome-binding factor A